MIALPFVGDIAIAFLQTPRKKISRRYSYAFEALSLKA